MSDRSGNTSLQKKTQTLLQALTRRVVQTNEQNTIEEVKRKRMKRTEGRKQAEEEAESGKTVLRSKSTKCNIPGECRSILCEGKRDSAISNALIPKQTQNHWKCVLEEGAEQSGGAQRTDAPFSQSSSPSEPHFRRI